MYYLGRATVATSYYVEKDNEGESERRRKDVIVVRTLLTAGDSLACRESSAPDAAIKAHQSFLVWWLDEQKSVVRTA